MCATLQWCDIDHTGELKVHAHELFDLNLIPFYALSYVYWLPILRPLYKLLLLHIVFSE